MASNTRSQKITKMLKVLATVYQPVGSVDRPVLEHLLYACCLENSLPDAADETFARLQELYFDWNEVRVTSVRELEEVMGALTDPGPTASRLTQCLQAVFESQYNFDLEHLKKINQGKAVVELQKLRGATPFAVQYVVQHALGGHSIPISRGILAVLQVLGVISESEAKAGKAPGLERAIPKNKGAEMASLLHQLGTDFHRSPFSPRVRETILKIAPDAKDRLPKRTRKKSEPAASGASKSAKAKGAAAKPATKKTPAKAVKKAAEKSGTPTKSSPTKKVTARSEPTKKAAPTKKSAAAKRKPPPKKKTSKAAPTKKSSSKSASKSLARRKPR